MCSLRCKGYEPIVTGRARWDWKQIFEEYMQKGNQGTTLRDLRMKTKQVTVLCGSVNVSEFKKHVPLCICYSFLPPKCQSMHVYSNQIKATTLCSIYRESFYLICIQSNVLPEEKLEDLCILSEQFIAQICHVQYKSKLFFLVMKQINTPNKWC